MANLQTLINLLKEGGYLDVDITTVVEVITRVALLKATAELLRFAQNTPEAAELEKVTNNTDGQKKLAELYQKTTGRSFEQLANEKLEESAGEYLAQRQKIAGQQTVPKTPSAV